MCFLNELVPSGHRVFLKSSICVAISSDVLAELWPPLLEQGAGAGPGPTAQARSCEGGGGARVEAASGPHSAPWERVQPERRAHRSFRGTPRNHSVPRNVPLAAAVPGSAVRSAGRLRSQDVRAGTVASGLLPSLHRVPSPRPAHGGGAAPLAGAQGQVQVRADFAALGPQADVWLGRSRPAPPHPRTPAPRAAGAPRGPGLKLLSANDVAPLLMGFVSLFSLEKCLFRSFAHFKLSYLSFLLLSHKSCLYIPDINSLSGL